MSQQELFEVVEFAISHGLWSMATPSVPGIAQTSLCSTVVAYLEFTGAREPNN